MPTVSPTREATKTTGRVAILGAVSVLVTWGLETLWPELPETVVAAILTLLAVGLDNLNYHRKSWLKVPF